MRHVLPGPRAMSARSIAILMTALMPAGAALADSKPLPPPASAAMPSVELTITMEGDRPVCAPAELRLPAETNVSLEVISHASQPVTITMEGQFENAHVLHADGDLVHVASEKGYTVKQNGKGTLRLRTIRAGEEPYACTGVNKRSDPFTGKVVLTPPAG